MDCGVQVRLGVSRQVVVVGYSTERDTGLVPGPRLTVEQEAEAKRIESLVGVKREFWDWQEDVLYVPPMFDHRKRKPPARIVDHLAANPIQPPEPSGNGNNAFLTEVAGLGASMNLESSLGDSRNNSRVDVGATHERADPRRPSATYLLSQVRVHTKGSVRGGKLAVLHCAGTPGGAINMGNVQLSD